MNNSHAPFSLALGLLLLGSCGAAAGPDERTNLVVISVDTLRPDFMLSYGHERLTSPRMDRFASEGVRFEDVTSASPWTLPSHASMLTGLYPSSHGVQDHDRQLTKGTLATRLKEEGYQTMAVVNSHNIGEKVFGLLRGFDLTHYEREAETDPDRPGLVGNGGARVTKRAMRFLDDRNKDDPFFLFLHYYDVHTDFAPDPKWELEYVSEYSGELTGNTLQLIEYRDLDRKMDPVDGRWLEEMYEAEIRTFDEIIGRLFDYMEANQLVDNTVVVITSDHGEEYLEHDGVLHGRTYYEEVIRIPILIRGPGIPAGKSVEDIAHLVDLAPTLFSLLDVDPEMEMDGLDLSGLWEAGGTSLPARSIFAEADHNNKVDGQYRSTIMRMIRRGHEKLIYNTITKKKEFYDLAADPLEQNDLSMSEPERLAPLWDELKVFIERPDTSGAREIEELSDDVKADLARMGYIDEGEDEDE